MVAGLPKREPGCKDCSNLDSCALSRLDKEELSQVARMIRQISYAKGEIIFHQGFPILGFYILCQGKAKLVHRTRSGKKVLLRFYSSGDLIGELIDKEQIYDASAEALEDSLVAFIEKTDFADLLRRYPQVSLEVIRGLSQELEALRRRLSALAYKGVRERLSELLLELEEKYGVKEEGSLRIDLPLSLRDLAEMVACSPQTASTELHKLARRRLVGIVWPMLRILNQEGLRQLG